jgi:chromosome segregation protein
MKLEFVEISGFRGFKHKTVFAFSSGFAVLTGRNGVGKSSVFDAVDFALTGTINKYHVKGAKGGGLEDHIWWVGEGPAEAQYVLVGFVNSAGQRFRVRRSRDNGLETSEKEISDSLCVPDVSVPDWPRILMQTSLIRDEMIAALSLDLTEQQRFSAVQAAMGGLRGPDYSERTKSIVRAAETAFLQQKEKSEAAQAELGRALGALTEARSLAANSSEIREAERIVTAVLGRSYALTSDGLATLRSMIAERKRSIGPLQGAATALDDMQATLAYFESEQGRSELELRNNERESAQKALDSTRLELTLAESKYQVERDQDAISLHLSALLEHGEAVGLIDGHCPLCDAVRQNEEFGEALYRLRAQLAERGTRAQHISSQVENSRQRLAQASSELHRADEAYEVLLSRRRSLDEGQAKIRELLAQFKIEGPINSGSDLRDLILREQEDTASLDQAITMVESSSAIDRVASFQNRVELLRTSSEVESTKVDNLARALELAKQIDKATKVVANELLSEQFETVLPLLKELYIRLRPHSEWQEIETDIGGHVRASLNFTVGDGRNPQFLFSSGQRRTAGIAFLLAIHLSRPWCKFETLLLDDPVQHIDDYRALNLAEVLSSIRKNGRQVIIAVEDSALADVLCRRLRSVLGDEGKRFELGVDASGSAIISSEELIYPLPKSVIEMAEAS